ncbi:AaceriAGL329Cp [[Ashbya] aceris (nom. inval.)]|nr:AaceriAGL329Cp [[Ashbya] aceris (nom. inval.)]
MAVGRYGTLVFYICAGLAFVGALEYFKHYTKNNYEWFHCTAVVEPVQGTTTVEKLFAVGGPPCDKRAELKVITQKLTKHFDPNKQPALFCIVENTSVEAVHYPVSRTNKGPAGYIAYAGYEADRAAVHKYCEAHGAAVLHM